MTGEIERAVDRMIEQEPPSPDQLDLGDGPRGAFRGTAINITSPNWESAVPIFLAVIANPDAPESGKQSAREEIMKMARFVDEINQQRQG